MNFRRLCFAESGIWDAQMINRLAPATPEAPVGTEPVPYSGPMHADTEFPSSPQNNGRRSILAGIALYAACNIRAAELEETGPQTFRCWELPALSVKRCFDVVGR